MPTYTFLNTETGEYFDLTMSMSQREDYVKNNPSHKQQLSSIRIGDPVTYGLYKTDNSFSNRLKEIKKNNYGSNIRTGNITEI